MDPKGFLYVANKCQILSKLPQRLVKVPKTVPFHSSSSPHLRTAYFKILYNAFSNTPLYLFFSHSIRLNQYFSSSLSFSSTSIIISSPVFISSPFRSYTRDYILHRVRPSVDLFVCQSVGRHRTPFLAFSGRFLHHCLVQQHANNSPMRPA